MAKSETMAQGTARNRKAALREQASRRKRRQNLMLIAGGAAFVLLLAAFVTVGILRQRPVAGEERYAAQGNLHIPFGSVSPITYNSTPPTSGPHYETLAAWGIHDEPVRYEHLVHNLEDGGVLVYYQCEDSCPELVAQLREIVEPYYRAGRNVALVPNDPAWSLGGSDPLHGDMGGRIAVVAWQRLLTLDEVNEDAIRAFIDRYEGIDHHPRG